MDRQAEADENVDKTKNWQNMKYENDNDVLSSWITGTKPTVQRRLSSILVILILMRN